MHHLFNTYPQTKQWKFSYEQFISFVSQLVGSHGDRATYLSFQSMKQSGRIAFQFFSFIIRICCKDKKVTSAINR